MAVSLTISQGEQKRVADLAYDNKTYKVFLANNTTSLTAESTASAWLAIELASSNGYAAVTGTVATGTGAWDGTDGRYEFPPVIATFTATGAGYTYNSVVVRIGSEASVFGVGVESPSITLSAGQSQSYSITFGQNDNG